tara:strand:+ start:97 stop:462 length:366 start_codon:yes stop_codon:yes gene_type:complete
MLKILFHVYNSIFLILYLYPGSILGILIYNNKHKQPQLTSDFLNISSNHFYAFLLLSFFGFLNFKKNEIFIIYLIILSIFLELSHMIIPNRSFQFSDLFGNIFGVLVPIFFLIIYYNWKKS